MNKARKISLLSPCRTTARDGGSVAAGMESAMCYVIKVVRKS
jgi:hypothetical protein